MKTSTKQTIAIILLAIAICFSDNLFSQNVTRDAAGNFKAITHAEKDTVNKVTSFIYQDGKGSTMPVYESGKGKMYIIKTSVKTGKEYKMYLKQ